MNGRRIPLFEIKGFKVALDPSWLLLGVLVLWSLSMGLFPSQYPSLSRGAWWAMGFFATLGLMASLLIHELAHSVVARRQGMEVSGITFFLFGGVSEAVTEPETPGAEFRMAIVGPLVSLALGGILLALAELAQGAGLAVPVEGVLRYLSFLNFLLAGFNLLPAFPLDGGRAFRAALWAWKKDLVAATRAASAGGTFFGVALAVVGVLSLLRGSLIGAIWWILIGLFLRGAAVASYRQVLMRQAMIGETARRFMTPDPITVDPEITVAELVDGYVYRYQHKMFPVVEGGRLVGCVGLGETGKLLRERWARTPVRQIVVSCPRDQVIPADTDARHALDHMKRTGHTMLLLKEGERLVGILSLKDMLRRLAFRIEVEQETGSSRAA